MITITSYRDEELTIISIEPLAWMMWPVEIAMLVFDTIRTTVEMVHSGNAVVLECHHYKEMFIPKGCRGITERHQITKTTTLTPVFRLTRYEDRADYTAAK